MPLNTNDLSRDAAAAAVPSEDALAQVSGLARDQIDIEDSIASTERILANLKSRLEKLRTQLLPAALAEYGLTEIRMADGSRVTVDAIVSASIKKDRRPEAFAWLEDHGFGDLIKHVISASFGRGEDEQAQAAIDALADLEIESDDKRSVHSGTLSAFVREQDSAGVALDDELLGVFRGEVAKITRPKR